MSPESKEAAQWTDNTLRALNNKGVWAIPRSGMLVHMHDYDKRTVRIVEGFAPDESVKVAIRNAKWHILGE